MGARAAPLSSPSASASPSPSPLCRTPQPPSPSPSPGRSSPRPRVPLLIVVSLRSATGRCGLIRTPDRKLRPLSYPPPPPKNSTKIPLKKQSRHAIPRPFQPKPRRPTFDCHVVRAGDRVDCSISTARSKNEGITSPPPPTNIVDFPFWKPSRCAFPRPYEPTPRRTLIDCHVFEARDRADRSNSSIWLQFNEALKPPRRP